MNQLKDKHQIKGEERKERLEVKRETGGGDCERAKAGGTVSAGRWKSKARLTARDLYQPCYVALPPPLNSSLQAPKRR